LFTMRTQPISPVALARLLLLPLLAACPALANNPLNVTSAGTPYKWNTTLVYTVDGGNLGTLSNAQANALVAQAFGTWTSVTTASVPVNPNPIGIGLGPDGDVSTVAEFNALFPPGPCPNSSYIIYDNDGSITDGLFGAGASNSILGFTSPCVDTATGSILAMASVLVVKPFVASAPSDLFKSYILGVFIHELGHGLGLGHSQVNVNCFAFGSCPGTAPGSDIFGVPTMFPVLLSQTEATNVSSQATLAADDISAISTLYPSPSFATTTGTISGIIYFGDGVNHFQGGNVIARRVGDPRVTAVSNVSGMFAQVDHGNPALSRPPSSFGSPNFSQRGVYTIPGLPPGTYTVEVESVYSSFTGGSSVGPIPPARGEVIPPPSIGPRSLTECLTVSESNTDGGLPCATLSVTANNVSSNNNLILNDTTLAAMDSFDAASRNDTLATATPLTAGTYSNLSISANNGPDVDFYAITIPAGRVLTVQTYSRRSLSGGAAAGRFLDSVIDFMDSFGSRLSSCRIGDDVTAFNQPCIDDDFTPTGGTRTQDSKLSFFAASATTVYVRVTDFLIDSRPDFGYDLDVAINPARAEIAAAGVNFGRALIGTSVTKSVSVGNVGAADLILANSPLALTNIPFSAPFVLAGGSTCVANLVLPPGSSCIANVTFQPSVQTSLFDSSLTITSNAFLNPNSVDLQGAGVDFSVLPNGLGFVRAAAGQPVSFGFQLIESSSPANLGTGLPSPTTFTVSGLPTGANATFNPSSIAANTSQNTTSMTVTTTSRSEVVPRHIVLPAPPTLTLEPLLGAAAVLIALPLFFWLRRMPAPRWITACSMLVVICLFASLEACKGGGGGGSGASTTPPVTTTPNPNGTPAGTYTLTITATSGPIFHSTTVTLAVN
jgi:hypothetical protein